MVSFHAAVAFLPKTALEPDENEAGWRPEPRDTLKIKKKKKRREIEYRVLSYLRRAGHVARMGRGEVHAGL
jgi:hypothetical protein